jgi:hypothetical protein
MFDSQKRQRRDFLSLPPCPVDTRDSSPSLKWLGFEANHPLPSSVKIKNALRYMPTTPYVFMAWCLIKNRNFTWCVYEVPGMILLQAYLYTSSLLRGLPSRT